MKRSIKVLIVLSIILICSYFFISKIVKNIKFNKTYSLLSYEQIQLIKKYILPYKVISQQQNKISQLEEEVSKQEHMQQYYLQFELDKKKIGTDIEISKSHVKLEKDITLKKYNLTSGFYYGIHEKAPGSGYIDFFNDNIFVLSSRGILAYRKNLDNEEENFKQINNNINNFININQFKKKRWFSIKDIHIFKDQIFISYTEEINENCWNTSVIQGNINYENIQFKKLFSPNECIHSTNNVDKIFNAHQSGGKIISFDDNHILLSIGDYRSRHLAQNKKSLNGKIIKININNSDYKIISMGHRNPQGLYFDKENSIILETEHGPMGGDEINLIDVKKINKDNILNYGWAIVSAGEHYGGKIDANKKIYEKYPLYKSHKKYGFIEPLKSFVPSIAISEITKIKENKYVTGSMKDKSLYFFELNEKNKIININRINVNERIRDLKFYKNKLYLFLENTASIGVIKLN